MLGTIAASVAIGAAWAVLAVGLGMLTRSTAIALVTCCYGVSFLRASCPLAAGRALPGDLAAARRAIPVHPFWRRLYMQRLTNANSDCRYDRARGLFNPTVRCGASRLRRSGRFACPMGGKRSPDPGRGRAGGPGGDRCASAELSEARNALDAHRVEDPSGFGAVSRRPLRRIVDALGQLNPAEVGSTSPST